MGLQRHQKYISGRTVQIFYFSRSKSLISLLLRNYGGHETRVKTQRKIKYCKCTIQSLEVTDAKMSLPIQLVVATDQTDFMAQNTQLFSQDNLQITPFSICYVYTTSFFGQYLVYVFCCRPAVSILTIFCN